MIITPPPQAMTLLSSVNSGVGAPAAFLDLSGFSTTYNSYMIIGSQMYSATIINSMNMRLIDDQGALSTYPANGSYSTFTASIETISVFLGQSNIPFSDTWDAAVVSKGGFRMWLDNVENIATSGGGSDFHPSYMGVCAIPKASPSDCTLTNKFSGSFFAANGTPAARSAKGIRFLSDNGVAIGGTIKLYGIR